MPIKELFSHLKKSVYVWHVCQGIQAFFQLNPLQLLGGCWQGRAGYRGDVSEESHVPTPPPPQPWSTSRVGKCWVGSTRVQVLSSPF